MKNKNQLILTIVLIWFIVGTLIHFHIAGQRDNLTLGIYVESYLNVPGLEKYGVFEEAIEKFEHQYPNVEVEYYTGFQEDGYQDYIAELILKGQAPDVFMVISEDFSKYVELGVLANLDSFLDKNDIHLEETHYTSTYQSGMHQGSVYALPYASSPTFMVVNKTLLEKNGMSVPAANWTWQDLYTMSNALTKDSDGDGKIDQFGIYDYSWSDAAFTNNVNIINPESGYIELNTIIMKEAVDFTKTIRVDIDQMDATHDDFHLGNVAFTSMSYDEILSYYLNTPNPGYEWEMIAMPTQEGDYLSYEVNTILMGVNAASNNKDEAFELLNILCNDSEIQTLMYQQAQGISPIKEITQSQTFIDTLQGGSVAIDLNGSDIGTVMEYGISQHAFQNYDLIVSIVDAELFQILNSKNDVYIDLYAMQNELNKYIGN